MTKLQKITFILIILLFASCKKNENNIEFSKDIEFNRNVLAEILPYKKEYEKIIVENFPKDTILKIKTDKAKEYILNFKNIKLNGKFKLKNINEFDKENIFERKYKFNFSGILRVSGIKFDKNRESGILDVGFTCGRLCGYGTKIFIKKVKNKWKIIKMEETWIS